MTVKSTFTNIAKPLKSNKRLWGLITISLIVIGALAIAYYFSIQRSQQEYREYKISMLDFYYEKAKRKLDNDVLTFTSKIGTTDIQSSDSITLAKFLTLNNLERLTRVNSIRKGFTNKLRISLNELRHKVRMSEQFDQHVILWKAVEDKSHDTEYHYNGSLQSNMNTAFLDTLYKGSAIKSKIIEDVSLNENSYILFTRQYTYYPFGKIASENPISENADSLPLNEIQVTLIGLVATEHYKNSTRKLNPWLSTVLIILLLLVIIGMPFFKLRFITEDERVFDRDVIFAGISVVVGGPIIIASFLGMHDFFIEYSFKIPHKLEYLSAQINSNFTKENEQLVKDLHNWNFAVYDSTKLANVKSAPCDNLPKPAERPDRYKDAYKILNSDATMHSNAMIAFDNYKAHIEIVPFPIRLDTSTIQLKFLSGDSVRVRIKTVLKNGEKTSDQDTTIDISLAQLVPGAYSFPDQPIQLKMSFGDSLDVHSIFTSPWHIQFSYDTVVYKGAPNSTIEIEISGVDTNHTQPNQVIELHILPLDTIRYKEYLLEKNFKFLLPVDKNGSVPYFVPFVFPPSILDMPRTLVERTYYKDIEDASNIWHLQDGKSEIQYVMRPVVSIESQEEEVVYILSTNGDSSYYRAGSVQLKSIHDPILLPGYQFAIIDDGGEVWFHSEKGRSTLENFYSATQRNKNLIASVGSRIGTGGVIQYRGEPQLYHVSPIKDTNLSIVLMYDLTIQNLKIAEVLTMASLFLLFAIVVMGITIILSSYTKIPKWGIFKFRTFKLDFLTPKRSRRGTYLILSAGMLISVFIAALIGFLTNYPPSTALALCILLTLWSYVIVYISLNPDILKKPYGLRIPNILLLVFAFTLTCFLNIFGGDKAWFAVIIILLATSFLAWMISRRPNSRSKIVIKIKRITRKIHFRHVYAMFLMIWLVLATLFPMYCVYRKASNLNDRVWVKTNQAHITSEFLRKKKTLTKLYGFGTTQVAGLHWLFNTHLNTGQYLDSAYSNLTESNNLEDRHKSQPLLKKLLWKTRPIYDDRVRHSQAFVFDYSSDHSWCADVENDKIQFTLNSKAPKGKAVQSTYRKSHEAKNGFGELSVVPALTKWSGILMILALLYLLIVFYIDRFFGLRFKQLQAIDLKSEANYKAKLTELLSSDNPTKGILLVGAPRSGMQNLVTNLFEKTSPSSLVQYSFSKSGQLEPNANIQGILTTIVVSSKVNDKNPINSDVVILEGLEYRISSHTSNRIKLRVISHFLNLKKKLILISEVYPSQIMDIYNGGFSQKNEDQNTDDNDLFAWRDMLSAFPQIVVGLVDTSEITKIRIEGVDAKNIKRNKFIDESKDFLVKELSHGYFLPEIVNILNCQSTDDDLNKSEKDSKKTDAHRLVMQIESLSHGYYIDIWNSLATRERYLLYDLASDGFMNIKNSKSLFSLMRKGLIVWEERPAVFNQSFQNFVLANYSKMEARAFEKKKMGQGSWGTIKVVLYLIIIAIVVFMALGEPALIKNFKVFTGAIAGFGAILPILSSMFSWGSK